MNKVIKILCGCFLFVLFAGGVRYWTQQPLTQSPPLAVQTNSKHMQYKNCTSCHQNSLFSDHTPKFFEINHGKAALINRQSCLNCHQNKNCIDCHTSKKPKWHNEKFCQPKLGPKHREEHFTLSSLHRHSCKECHQQKFQVQCATCHLPEVLK